MTTEQEIAPEAKKAFHSRLLMSLNIEIEPDPVLGPRVSRTPIGRLRNRSQGDLLLLASVNGRHSMTPPPRLDRAPRWYRVAENIALSPSVWSGSPSQADARKILVGCVVQQGRW